MNEQITTEVSPTSKLLEIRFTEVHYQYPFKKTLTIEVLRISNVSLHGPRDPFIDEFKLELNCQETFECVDPAEEIRSIVTWISNNRFRGSALRSTINYPALIEEDKISHKLYTTTKRVHTFLFWEVRPV